MAGLTWSLTVKLLVKWLSPNVARSSLSIDSLTASEGTLPFKVKWFCVLTAVSVKGDKVILVLVCTLTTGLGTGMVWLKVAPPCNNKYTKNAVTPAPTTWAAFGMSDKRFLFLWFIINSVKLQKWINQAKQVVVYRICSLDDNVLLCTEIKYIYSHVIYKTQEFKIQINYRTPSVLNVSFDINPF